MIRALLLRLLDGVPYEDTRAMSDSVGGLEALVDALRADLARVEAERDAAVASKHDAYDQRDELAVLCARMARLLGYTAGWGQHNGPPFQDRPHVLRIGLPPGDVSYHLREKDPRIDNMPAWSWDSADKEENRRRVRDTTIRNRRADDAQAKLAEATSPLALAERRYAQAWWAWRTKPLGLGDTGDMAEAREALRAAYAAAAKGEGGEGER